MNDKKILKKIILDEIKHNGLSEAPREMSLAEGEWFEILLAAGKDDCSKLLIAKDTLNELGIKVDEE